MPIKNYNTPPYYDDFDQTKNYLRVLFRPGYSVQARELTQLQTSIQAQIDRFGSHLFKDGSRVLGAEVTLNTEYAYIKLEPTVTVSSTAYSADVQAPLAVGRTITGAVTGITATVLQVVTSTPTDPTTLYVRYTKASDPDSSGKTYSVFGAGEKLSFSPEGGGTRWLKVGAVSLIPVGYGTRLSVTEGVFFISGCFVYSPATSFIVAKYANRPSARVVYAVTESIVTQAEDPSLTDNAQGTPNAAAPGAHRYAISLDLKAQNYNMLDRSEPGIIQVAVIKNGKLVQQARTEYSELADTLAQRTYEESGNYTVRPFQINIREYYNDGSNGGLYTAEQINEMESAISNNTAAEEFGRARLAVGLEPAVAYVNGYRIELTDTQYIPVEKARDEGYINAASSVASMGNYVLVKLTGSCGLPDITNFAQLELRTATGGGGTLLGYARARSIEYDSYDSGSSSNIYRLYLFDVQMSGSYYFAQTTYVYQNTGSGPTFNSQVFGTATLTDVGNNSLVYKLPADAIQSLRTSDGLIDTLYYVKRKYDNRTTDGSGIVTIAAAADEIFESSAVTDWTAVTSGGTFATPNTISIGSGGSSITLTFTSYASTSMYIIGPSRRNLREKIKQYVTNYNVAIATPNTTPGLYDSLGVTDLFKVQAIYMSANLSTAATTSDTNVTDRYSVDDGQRDNFYDVARIQLKAGAVVPVGRLLVVLDYFAHQPGDYFSVDSYTGIPYEQIPAFQSSRGLIQLRDAIDFRPTKNTSGTNFTGTGASVVSMVKPNSVITSDIQYYLPRTDKIYVDKFGNFGVAKGVSAITPLVPNDPKDSMVLYVLKLGAYTFAPEHVVPVMLDNRRYTMRDIGKIEKRLSNIEYYTALSLLEKDTAGMQIFDGSNVRYKNGFIVDSFHGHGIGASSHPDYACSIDRTAGKLRPSFYQDNVKLLLDIINSSNVRKTGSLLSLDYVQTNEIEQPYASTQEYLNPFNVFNWVGQLFLSPGTDEWRETLRKPQVVIDQAGTYSTYQVMSDNNAGQTVWNDWQTTWSGQTVTDEITKSGDPTFDWSPTHFGWSTESNTTQTVRTDTRQTRSGIRTSYVPSVQYSNQGDRTVEMNVVPYIRSRKIYFKAIGMKPGTRVYAFFDGTDVSDYVTPETDFIDYATRSDSSNYLDVTQHPDGPAPLYTNASGVVIGSFVIPNTPTLKFKTGNRIFRLTTSATNASTNITTSAEAVYSATGTQVVTENVVIATRSMQVVQTAVTDTRVISSNSTRTDSRTDFKPTLWPYSWYATGGLTPATNTPGTSTVIDPATVTVTNPTGTPTTVVDTTGSTWPNNGTTGGGTTSITPTVVVGGALNVNNQLPVENAVVITNANVTTSYDVGGTFNPPNTVTPVTSTATEDTGFAVVKPGDSTATVSTVTEQAIQWTPPEIVPPEITVVSFPTENLNAPVLTPVSQTLVIPPFKFQDPDVTLQRDA